MSGEINATTAIIADSVGDIVGQLEFTMTWNGTPIDISNKSYQDWVTLMDVELASKQMQLSGTIVYNDDLQYQKVKADALTGTMDTYTLTYGLSGETMTAKMMPNGLSDALPHGDKIQTSITFLSSGVVTHTPQTAAP